VDERWTSWRSSASITGMSVGPSRTPDPVLALVRAQSGVVRREQLAAVGVSPRTLGRRIADGLWEPRGKRALVFAGTAPGLLTESLVVAHALHPRGVLTGFSALVVRGELGRDPWAAVFADPQPWVLYPHDNRLPARTIREVPDAHQLAAEVPVVTRDRALVDLARHLPFEEARRLVFRAAQVRGSAATMALLERAADLARGHSGAGRVRALVAELATGAHSDAENLLLSLLVEAGFTGYVANLPVRLGGVAVRIDVAFPQARLAIEVDGRAFHSSPQRFQHDRTRQNRLVAGGWRVLRFTWEDLTQRPEQVLHRIAELLEP
jgi:very-short-patch-repair endonuclease